MFNTPEQLRQKLEAQSYQKLYDYTKSIIFQTLDEYIAGSRIHKNDVWYCCLSYKQYEIYLSSFKKHLIEKGWAIQELYWNGGAIPKLVSDSLPSKEETDTILLYIKEK